VHCGLPRGNADQQRAQNPSDVKQRAEDISALRDLQQIDGVGDGKDGDARTEVHPAAVKPPTARCHGANHDAKQDHVAERIGQVRRHGGCVATG
jgi:hypothetical protein